LFAALLPRTWGSSQQTSIAGCIGDGVNAARILAKDDLLPMLPWKKHL
jgi:hypothetical protein